jgi:hypothetical protein
MKASILRLLIATGCMAVSNTVLIANEEDKAAQEERVKARLAERAKAKAEGESKPASAKDESPASTLKSEVETDTPDKAEVTTLPEIEVRQTRIYDIDIKIRKLNREIAREQKKVKPTDADAALNNPKASRILSVFGGKSAEQRSAMAAERVYLMEQERELLELMKLPMTAAKLTELEQQADALRSVRRNLDVELR